jgi:thiamine-phosphate pyrophosphorylase
VESSPRLVERLPAVYPIIDTGLCRQAGLDPVGVAAACLRGGATLLQLRAKGEASGAILAWATQIQALAAGRGARLVVNDRADLALMAGAAGVHLGQEDLPVDVVRALVGPGFVVGLSTHTEAQVDAVPPGLVSYVAVGPIFDTPTKDTGYTPRGIDLVRHAAATVLPVVAIGGITLARAASVFEAGAQSVAVISDLLDGGDVEGKVRAYLATETARSRK